LKITRRLHQWRILWKAPEKILLSILQLPQSLENSKVQVSTQIKKLLNFFAIKRKNVKTDEPFIK
jgi:hypothetical protein